MVAGCEVGRAVELASVGAIARVGASVGGDVGVQVGGRVAVAGWRVAVAGWRTGVHTAQLNNAMLASRPICRHGIPKYLRLCRVDVPIIRLISDPDRRDQRLLDL